MCSQDAGLWGFQARMKGGFLLGHRGVMGHLPREHAIATEFSYIFRTSGDKKWHFTYKMPDIGLNFFYGSVGNTQILGRYTGLFGSIAFPLVSRNNFRFNFTFAGGLGYTNKKYDPETNPKNVAIGSHFNALVELRFDATKYFHQNWISLGIDLTHFSNGSLQVPNLGINIPYLSLAYGRFLNTKSDNSPTKTNPQPNFLPQGKILYGLTAIASAKEVYPTGERKYGVYALSLHARIFTRPKAGWEFATDFIHKQSTFLAYRKEIPKELTKIPQIGLYLGYILPLDQLHFVLGMGAYVRDFYNPDDLLYHRVGMRYYFKNGVFVNLVLKTHWARADYVEWGIGYSFLNKKMETE